MRPRGLSAGPPARRRPATAGRRALEIAIAAVAITATWLVWSTAALAHTDLTATRPADGETLAESVARIELEFSGALDSAATSARVLDADGAVIPIDITHMSDELVVVVPHEALDGGRFVVFWSVRSSSDGHEISDSFAFEVATGADASTDTDTDAGTEPAPTEETAAADAPVADDTATEAAGDSDPPTVPTTTAAPVPTTVATAAPPAPMDEDGTASDVFEWLGRWIAMTGAIVGVGAIGFAATSLVGTAGEVRRAASWIRIGGVLILAGSLLELTAAATAQGYSLAAALMPWTWLETLTSAQGYAMVLRIAGAIAMLQSPRMVLSTPGPPVSDPLRAGTGHAGAVEGSTVATATRSEPTANRLEIHHEWLTIAGAAMVIASFGLDGHTGNAGLIGRVASMTHVFAAGIWAGGLVVMADLLIRRHRSSMPMGVADVAVRFSRVASAALVLTAVAGGILAWRLVDEPSEVWSGAWGRALTIKLVLVAVAAAIGAYNHFRVVPRLDQPDAHATGTLRRTVTIESLVLVIVVAVTAVLVSAAP